MAEYNDGFSAAFGDLAEVAAGMPALDPLLISRVSALTSDKALTSMATEGGSGRAPGVVYRYRYDHRGNVVEIVPVEAASSDAY